MTAIDVTDHTGLNPPTDRTFRVQVDLDARRVVARGELDLETAPSLFAAGQQLTRTPGPVDLDLAGVSFIDSRGLAMIIGLNNELSDRNGDAVRVCGAAGATRRTFLLAGVEFLLAD
jgi:anti-sigma B factor antagonist